MFTAQPLSFQYAPQRKSKAETNCYSKWMMEPLEDRSMPAALGPLHVSGSQLIFTHKDCKLRGYFRSVLCSVRCFLSQLVYDSHPNKAVSAQDQWPRAGFDLWQKQGFLCTPPQVQKTTPEQCSREQKGAQQCNMCVCTLLASVLPLSSPPASLLHLSTASWSVISSNCYTTCKLPKTEQQHSYLSGSQDASKSVTGPLWQRFRTMYSFALYLQHLQSRHIPYSVYYSSQVENSAKQEEIKEGLIQLY